MSGTSKKKMYALKMLALLFLLLTVFSACTHKDEDQNNNPPPQTPPPPGQTTVLVPSLTSLTQTEAQAELTKAGLILGQLSQENSVVIPAGLVKNQQPQAGVSVDINSAVDLVVSLGPPAQLNTPDVVGLTQDAATTVISNSGFKLGAVTTANSDTIAKGLVISQVPAANVSAASASTIALLVSLGPAQVSVPDIIGLTQAEAKARLAAVGLLLGTVGSVSDRYISEGRIAGQTPSYGSRVDNGSTVDILISLGPVPVAMPDLVGLNQADAETKLYEAGLELGMVRMASSETIAFGSVVEQSQYPGFMVTPGTLINLVIASGIATTANFSELTVKNSPNRGSHSATRLLDGTVLICGGRSNSGPVLDSAEIYDPTTRTFTAIASTMNSPRNKHSATLLANGEVLLTGGNDGTRNLSSAELYDPISQSFTLLSQTLTTLRNGHGAALLPDNTVLIAGGDGFGSAEIYDPVTQSFTAIAAAMNEVRNYFTMTALGNGQVMIAGGWVATTPNSCCSVVDSVEIYDPVSKIFQPLNTTMTTGRVFHAATLLSDGNVLISGGAYSAAQSNTEIYNPSNNTFTPAANMPRTRENHSLTTLANGDVIVIGGDAANNLDTSSPDRYLVNSNTYVSDTPVLYAKRANHTMTTLNSGLVLIVGSSNGQSGQFSVEMFDPVMMSTQALAITTQVPRLGHSATLLNNGQVLIAGGYDNSAEIYDPPSNTFTLLTATMTEARTQHSAALLNDGRVLLAGGWNGTTNLNNAELYDPTSKTFSAVPNLMNLTHSQFSMARLPDGSVMLVGGGVDAAAVEIYDPLSQTFTLSNLRLNVPRWGHCMVPMGNGDFVIFGGMVGYGYTFYNSAEIYSFANNTFTGISAAMVAEERQDLACARLSDGRIIASGGFNYSQALDSFELFTP